MAGGRSCSPAAAPGLDEGRFSDMAASGFGVPRDPHEDLSISRGWKRPIKAVAFGATGLSAAVIAVVRAAPWWMVAVLITVAALCALVETVFPQESADRLEWWRDYRRAQAGSRSRERGAVAARIVEREETE